MYSQDVFEEYMNFIIFLYLKGQSHDIFNLNFSS
jgi:hypothetical protein